MIMVQTYANNDQSFCCCRTETMNGLVTVNGRSRDLRLFRRQVAYIMQEGVLQQHITVWEAMFFSASLKIGGQMTKAEKKRRVSLSI